MRRNKVVPNDSLNQSSANDLKKNLQIVTKPLPKQNNKKADFMNIDLVDDQLESKDQQQKYCRICLQIGRERVLNSKGEPQESYQNELINACRCQGSVGYVHNKCMIQWIKSQIKRDSVKTILCQICLSKIHYRTGIDYYFNFKIQNFVKRVRIYHLILLIVTLLAMTILGTFMGCKDQFSFQISTLPMVIMGVTEIFLLMCALTLVSLIIRDCFMERNRIIEYIYAYQQWQKHLEMHPSLREIISIRSSIQSRRTINQNIT